jgi:hypothetical protein
MNRRVGQYGVFLCRFCWESTKIMLGYNNEEINDLFRRAQKRRVYSIVILLEDLKNQIKSYKANIEIIKNRIKHYKEQPIPVYTSDVAKTTGTNRV